MDINDLLAAVLPLCPDAQISEDNTGEIVVMTGVRAKTTVPLQPPAVLASKWYLQPCIRLADYCDEQGLDVGQALEVLRRSDIRFGTNDDTLVGEGRLCRLLGIEPPAEDRYMISLGC